MITKVALNALKMRAPYLSEAALKKVQDAGMIKPVEELMPGWQKGTKNLAKRYHADISTLTEKHPILGKLLSFQGGGGLTFGGGASDLSTYLSQKTRLLPNFIKKRLLSRVTKTLGDANGYATRNPIIAYNAKVTGNAKKDFLNQLTARHELSEAKHATRYLREGPGSGGGKPFRTAYMTYTDPVTGKVYKQGFSHQSLQVLGDENKFLLDSGHPELFRGTFLQKGRTATTGEHPLLSKITGNPDLLGSNVATEAPETYSGISTGLLRKWRKNDADTFRRFVQRNETGTSGEYIKGKARYEIPVDTPSGLQRLQMRLAPLRDKIYAVKKKVRTAKDWFREQKRLADAKRIVPIDLGDSLNKTWAKAVDRVRGTYQ